MNYCLIKKYIIKNIIILYSAVGSGSGSATEFSFLCFQSSESLPEFFLIAGLRVFFSTFAYYDCI